MRKTTVYLGEEEYRALKRLARQRRKPEAALIREALQQYTKSGGRPRPKSLGLAAGPGDTADRVDELLAQGFGRDGAHR
ncbi:MAG: CopG family transcriptional regulator [Myxococcota bacterium]